MKKINFYILLFVALLSILGTGCITEQTEDTTANEASGENHIVSTETQIDTIYQFSVINALLEGVYDGEITCGELKEKGDFGLGTFDDLNGEMLELDGVIYQVKADGNAYEVEDTETSPFAAVTFFEADIENNTNTEMSNQEMASYIEDMLPSQNLMYAIKVTGNFSYMKTRSVAAQEKPYPRLVDVTRDQSVFEFNNTSGTIVGYWMPEFVYGINVPGYHLHFITADRTAGGHILDYTITSGTIEIDSCDGFNLELPENENYLSTGLSADNEGDLEVAEN
ncbi:acetolactate decarboxylase [Methanolobus sediminis]|uniref:Alpha-acetolactate decarboxylase n=1 Tax=Methanolobus sediminis TaxID=3072978 RepID=A0AA51UJY0_9EURY|nr:acetolactate decarboxylase [Methanolobus sediminis]WMW24924.1 acetolactate decarboxylase [Methanolobus sediminis]